MYERDGVKSDSFRLQPALVRYLCYVIDFLRLVFCLQTYNHGVPHPRKPRAVDEDQ